jgi:hypothetical protein
MPVGAGSSESLNNLGSEMGVQPLLFSKWQLHQPPNKQHERTISLESILAARQRVYQAAVEAGL